jgi:lysyl-tRNA synthetase class 1
MALDLLPEVVQLLASFDARLGTFEVVEVADAIRQTAKDLGATSPEQRSRWWAEWAAFAFDVDPAPGGGPWNTYFQPMMTRRGDAGAIYTPDLREADAEVLAHWRERATAVKHPVLAARYADLVWDTTRVVTGERASIEFPRLAIDSYVAGLQLDDGTAWGDNFYNTGRALRLALSIRDEKRVASVVQAMTDYADKTAEDDKLGTYCYLFDHLLPAEKGPKLAPEQEEKIVAMFEARFAEMTKSDGPWAVEPHAAKDVGLRLAGYYARNGNAAARAAALRRIAEAFERRAKMGDALTAMFFLDDAREFFLLAGLRAEAERVQAEAQKVGPQAEKQLVRTTVTVNIPNAGVEKYLESLMQGGLDDALHRFATEYIPDQAAVAKEVEEAAKTHPVFSIFMDSAKIMGDGHIEADVADDAGDPDGRMAHHTSRHAQLTTQWLAWALDRMVREGLDAAKLVEFVRRSSLFTDDRLPLITQGVDAHFRGDYVQSVHLLIPQIERGLVGLTSAAGKPSNKPHRGGRGVMQFKNLNDVLTKDGWPIQDAPGENLRMYLLAMLAHPKGLNIRNDVCHGLWSAARFTRVASERVVHVLLAVSLVRPAPQASADAPTPGGESAGGGASPGGV